MAAYKNPIPSVEYNPKEYKERRDFEPEENDYTFKESVYFVFIDVLGFKKEFDDNRHQKDDRFAEKFKEVFTYYFDLMSSANFMLMGQSLRYAGQTSDSLYFYTEREDYLIEFLKIFSHLNVYAMTKDVFLRGGIAKGNLFYKKDYQFYGESVIYAYLLESEISKNPIIMIDENTYKAMESNSECEKLVNTKNGRHYIRPFAYLEHKFDLDIDEPSIEIKEIDQKLLQNTIEQNKSKFEYDAKNYGKYVYLLDEYNEYKNRI